MMLALLLVCVVGSAAQLILVTGDSDVRNPFEIMNAPVPKVVCYFSGWAVKRPGIGAFSADNIDPFSCTHFIYAFAALNPETYTIQSLGDEEEYEKFVQLKRKNPAAKVMIALGGWAEGAKKYSVMARVPERRAIFIATALDFVQKYGFDGLDLDWEYPGAVDRDGVPEDKKNFIELLKEMNQAFYNRGYILSAAITPVRVRVDMGYNVPEMTKYLDFINVMTYDLHGSWEGYADHHSRLFRRPQDEGGYEFMNADAGIQYLLRKGAEPHKLVMGIPFYGRAFTLSAKSENSSDISKVIGRGEAGNYTDEPGFLAYFEICPKFKEELWVKTRDKFAGVPFMYQGDQWIGYDDVDSVAIKISYIRSHGLGGAVVFSIDLDDFRGDCGEKWPLITKINQGIWAGVGQPLPIDQLPAHPINGHAFGPAPPSNPHVFNALMGMRNNPFPSQSPHQHHHPIHHQFLQMQINRHNANPVNRMAPFLIQNAHEGTLMQGLGHPAIEMQSLRKISLCTEDYLFTDLDDCNYFYQCAGGYLRRLICPGHLMYNEKTQACENANRVICLDTKDNDWTCLHDGMFSDPKSCRNFYWCHGDTFNHVACGPNTFFNQETGTCFHEQDVKCDIQEEITTEIPSVVISSTTEEAKSTSDITVNEISTASTTTPTTTGTNPTTRTTTTRVSTTPEITSTAKLSSSTSIPSSTIWDWRPTISRPTDRPGTIPPNLTNDFRVVCYFTNWAWYRPADGKFFPEDTDVALCTHIIYAFTVLHPEELTIKVHDPWADVDNDFFRRVVRLKERKPDLKVLVGLGGWNDSLGGKYSRLVNDPAARRRFIDHLMRFIQQYNFDGIDLDWEYPKCWQVDCKKGPDSDKPSFTAWVREIREAFNQFNSKLLLSAAVSPSKFVIDKGYEVAELAKLFDFISVMTYDFHGSWEKFTGHNAPLHYYPGDEFDHFNANFSINYWIELGTPREKLVMGLPAYGQTWTLVDSNQHGLGANATGPGEAGVYTRQGGMLSYYEICQKLRTESWTVVKDPQGRIGPYAFKNNQWVSFDDIETIIRKAQFIKTNKLGGAMLWSLDFDDYNDLCCTEEYPILKAVNRELRNYPPGPNKYARPCIRRPQPGPSDYSNKNSHTQGHVITGMPNVCITSRCLT